MKKTHIGYKTQRYSLIIRLVRDTNKVTDPYQRRPLTPLWHTGATLISI